MKISELLHPGNKIDIRLIQQVVEQTDGEAKNAKIYKSQILDIKPNEDIEVLMPTEGGRLMLLPLNVRFEFVFYGGGGMYRATGIIVERYKKENIYMLLIRLKSSLERFQRREYYRLPMVIEVDYYDLTEEEAKMNSGDAIFVRLSEGEEVGSREHTCKMVDISGGGVRLNVPEPLEAGRYIMLALRLVNDKLNKMYYLVGQVIESIPVTAAKERHYESRVKFLLKDDKVREEIIQFIFEEDRKARSIKH